MRAAQIYIQEPTPERIRRIVDVLHRDPRVDQVIWCAGLTGDDTPGEFVVSSRRGQIQFARGDGPRDDFGTRWTWTGEPDALRFACDRGEIEWREYPNAFERIAGVLDAAHGGQIWATAIPGCEFEVPGGDAHVGGGSHGALHALDSLSPVIAAGPPGAVVVPRSFRSVDIAPLCARSLGIGMRYRVGEPRPGRVALERQRSAAAVLGGRRS
jgi:hypothetical protein